jgi:hypothetical protein
MRVLEINILDCFPNTMDIIWGKRDLLWLVYWQCRGQWTLT